MDFISNLSTDKAGLKSIYLETGLRFCKNSFSDSVGDVDPIARMESFRALKLSRLESFRALTC